MWLARTSSTWWTSMSMSPFSSTTPSTRAPRRWGWWSSKIVEHIHHPTWKRKWYWWQGCWELLLNLSPGALWDGRDGDCWSGCRNCQVTLLQHISMRSQQLGNQRLGEIWPFNLESSWKISFPNRTSHHFIQDHPHLNQKWKIESVWRYVSEGDEIALISVRSDWSEVGHLSNSVVKVSSALDGAGRHGKCLALQNHFLIGKTKRKCRLTRNNTVALF